MNLPEINQEDLLVKKEQLDILLSPYYSGIFLLLDGIISIDEDKREIVAYKEIGVADPTLVGHMKNKVCSGLFSAEYFTHACIFLILKMFPKLKGEPRIADIHISFKGEIRSGDKIRIFAKLIRIEKTTFFFTGHLVNQYDEKVMILNSMNGRLLSQGILARAKRFLLKK